MTPQDPHTQTEEAIRRGREAQRVMDEPLLKEAFEKVAADITGLWATTAPGDAAAREQLYMKLRALQDVREHLRAVAAGGKVALHMAERKLKMFQPTHVVR